MSTQIQKTNSLPMKEFFNDPGVRAKVESVIGKRAPQFITSVLQIASSNSLLVNAEPSSVLNAAMVAATLDLPLNNNLGFAYIVPYSNRQPDGSKKVIAQFQIGYKGFIQLAQRSGQFRTISACAVYEGQILNNNPLTGITFDFSAKTSDKVIGFASYFELINGFQKTLYLTIEEVQGHGKKFSKNYDNGLWKTDFESMAMKTVIKLLLAKYAPLSIEMQRAVVTDQAQVIDPVGEVQYVDNPVEEANVVETTENKKSVLRERKASNQTEIQLP